MALIFVVLTMQSAALYMLCMSLDAQRENIISVIDGCTNTVSEIQANQTDHIACKVDEVIAYFKKAAENSQKEEKSNGNPSYSISFNLFVQEPFQFKPTNRLFFQNAYSLRNIIFHSSFFAFEQPHPPRL